MTAPIVMRGKVTKVVDGRPYVEVADLGKGYEFGPVEVADGVALHRGNRVLVVSVGDVQEDVVVVGVLDVPDVGDWDPITAAADVGEVGAGYNPAARLECGGTVVRLRGTLRATDDLTAGAHLFRLDATMRPFSTVLLARVEVGADGWVSLLSNLADGATVPLDGLTFTV